MKLSHFTIVLFLLLSTANLFSQKKKTVKVKAEPKILVGPFTDTIVHNSMENYITIENLKIKNRKDLRIIVTGAGVSWCPNTFSTYIVRTLGPSKEVKIILNYCGKEIYNKTFKPFRIPSENLKQWAKRYEAALILSKAACK